MGVKLTTTAATPDNADNSLPDPSKPALQALGALVVVAAGIAVGLNAAGLTGRPFAPPAGDVNFSVFAGLYAGAQIIERAMEFVVPLLPVRAPAGTATQQAAQVKADRAKWALGVTCVLGVLVSCGFGLFLLETIGIHSGSNTLDTFVTGLLIGAGTKPLHDLISTLQNQSSPTTGTEVVTSKPA